MAENEKNMELALEDLNNVAGGLALASEVTDSDKAKLITAIDASLASGVSIEKVKDDASRLLNTRPDLYEFILDLLEKRGSADGLFPIAKEITITK